MVGDSIISWAGQGNPQLDGDGMTYWKGRRGAHMAETTRRVRQYLARHAFPTTLIIHVGTNDLFTLPVQALRRVLLETLISIRNLLPHTRILWSDILHRMFYHGQLTPRGGKRSVISLNKYAARVCRDIGNAGTIRHYRVINPSNQAAYRYDGLHLSPIGNNLFREDLGKALVFFRQNPTAPSFTPLPLTV